MVPDIPRLNNPGLGDEFTAVTGLNASDPRTWQAQVDFSLYKASTGGWTLWSTMRAAGLHKWSGIDQSQNGRDASQDYFQDHGPGRDLANSGAPSQDQQLYGFGGKPFFGSTDISQIGGASAYLLSRLGPDH